MGNKSRSFGVGYNADGTFSHDTFRKSLEASAAWAEARDTIRQLRTEELALRSSAGFLVDDGELLQAVTEPIKGAVLREMQDQLDRQMMMGAPPESPVPDVVLHPFYETVTSADANTNGGPVVGQWEGPVTITGSEPGWNADLEWLRQFMQHRDTEAMQAETLRRLGALAGTQPPAEPVPYERPRRAIALRGEL